MATVDWKNYDPQSVIYGKPFPLKTGGSMTGTTYQHPDGTITPLVIQTPRAPAPFGISYYDAETNTSKHDIEEILVAQKKAAIKIDKKNEKKPSISVSFKGLETDPTMEKFYAFVEKMDLGHLNAGKKNAAEWFKKTKNPKTKELEPPSSEVVETMYTDSIKPPGEKHADAPPTIKFKIPIRDSEIVTKIFDRNKKPVSVGELPMGGDVVCLIEPSIWNVQGKFGCTWSCQQIKSYGGGTSTTYAFKTESDDEEEEQQSTEDTDTPPPLKKQKN